MIHNLGHRLGSLLKKNIYYWLIGHSIEFFLVVGYVVPCIEKPMKLVFSSCHLGVMALVICDHGIPGCE